MNGNPLGIMLFVVVFAGLMGGLTIAQIKRSQQLVQKWATENGYQLVQVYQIVVQDEQGYERDGWLRLGGYSSGLLSDQVEVRWDE
jgi:hypothetical protein